MFKRPPGRPKAETPKISAPLRLDANVADHFKADGPGWQMRINVPLAAALRGVTRGTGYLVHLFNGRRHQVVGSGTPPGITALCGEGQAKTPPVLRPAASSHSTIVVA